MARILLTTWQPYRQFNSEILPQEVQNSKKNGTLTVGMLPNSDIITSLGDNGALLSVVEDFELEGIPGYRFGLDKALRLQQQDTSQTRWAQIKAKDFIKMSNDDLEKGADWIHEKLMQGRNLYVHCKTGVGRAASVVIAYFIKYGKKGAQEAILLVQSQRPETNLNHEQQEALVDFFEYIQAQTTR